MLEDSKDSKAYLESLTFCCLRDSLKAALSAIKLLRFKIPRRRKKNIFLTKIIHKTNLLY